MNFLYPNFMYALAALAIPIVIHLFNFRRYKKVYFTNVRLLRSVQQETKSRSRLKHILILISRLLAITFLVFAFAQPYIPLNHRKVDAGERDISIYVDNSFSMNALTSNGTALDVAKAKAKAIIKAYSPTAKFQLIDNNFNGVDQHFYSQASILTHLPKIQSSASVKNTDEVLKRFEALQNSNLGKKRVKEVYLISDFQANAFNISQHHFDSTIHYHFIPISSQTSNNVYIDSCWFSSPVHNLNTDEVLHVKITNAGKKTILNAPLKLYINGEIKTPASYTLNPDESKTFKLHFKSSSTGIQTGKVLIHDYPISFDDQLFFSFDVAPNINVLNILSTDSQSTQINPIEALFKNDDYVKYTSENIQDINFGALSQQNLIILDDVKQIPNGLGGTLTKYVEDGGSVLLFPNADADLNSLNNFISSFNGEPFSVIDTTKLKANNLNLNQTIFKNVFTEQPKKIAFPNVSFHFKTIENSRTSKEKIISLENNDAFLTEYPFDKGKIYVCTSPLNDQTTDFSKNALFVPIVYNIAIYSQRQIPLYYTIGENQGISVAADSDETALYHIQSKNFDIIPEKRIENNQTLLFDHQQINQQGIYNIALNKKIMSKVAFNFNRKESDLRKLTASELSDKIKSLHTKAKIDVIEGKVATIGKKIHDINNGRSLWKLCIILALIFLAIEILLIKFLK